MGPVGANTDVGPRPRQPAAHGVEPSAQVRRTERPELAATADHLLAGVEYRDRQALAAPIFPYRNGFDVAAAQRGAAVQQAALDDGAVRDDRAAMPDQGVHSAERVVPVGVGEVAGERVVDHVVGALSRVAFQVGGVDQAGGVYLGVHTAGLPGGPVLRYTTDGRPGPRPVQPHLLAGSQLGERVDVVVGDHADHRIAAGHRVIGTEDDR